MHGPDRVCGTGAPSGRIEDTLGTVQELITPKLRGWLHAGMFPVCVLLGALLVIRAPQGDTRWCVAVFAVTAALLFGTSALYHCGHWTPRTSAVLQRVDHANIFLIIAGTYTPFSVFLLSSGSARVLLWIVWSGAVLGGTFRVVWARAPRWLYVLVYMLLGWAALGYLRQFMTGGGLAVFILVLSGGALYTVGALIYGLQHPDPSPQWFGFHEVFHVFTVLAFLTHYAGVLLAARSQIT